MTSPAPLEILWLSDGKPGHYSLSEAIIAALSRKRSTSTTRVEVTRPLWLPPRLLSTITNIRPALVPRLLGLDFARIPTPAVIVSAGGDTLAANVAAARHFAVPNVFYGSLRRYRPEDFALVLTSYAEHDESAPGGRPNTVMTLKPSPRDPDQLPMPPRDEGTPLSIGVLIGGDSGTIHYDTADWDRLIALVSEASAAPLRLTVANSRRTPVHMSDRLACLATRGAIAFIDVRTAGPGTLGPLFAGSHAVVATVDSSSMISEAVWARRPVVVLTPAQWSLPALEQKYRQDMERQGWTASLPLADATPAKIATTIRTLSPLTTNPLDDLSNLIERRLKLP